MSNKNPTGALTRLNPEWGSKARKEYDELKGVNHTARRQVIEEQLADLEEDDSPVQYFFDELGEFHE